MKRWYLFLAIAVLIVGYFAVPPDRERLYPTDFGSFEICARDGEVLREVLSRDFKTSIWSPTNEISPWLVRATVWREDKRFLMHRGVDPLALLRAVWINLRHGRIMSGGSTITMQVAKMALDLKGSRSLFNKLIEIIYAMKIELHLSKREILEIYLNRAPYGFQNYGVEAASRFYFRKPAQHLSLNESILLTIIPAAPSRLNPYVGTAAIDLKRKGILEDFLRSGQIDSLEFLIALKEPVRPVAKDLNFVAPHFVDYVLKYLSEAKKKNIRRVNTTIDISLQRNLEKFLYTTLESLKGYNVGDGAVLVQDKETGEILAMVGSKDYFDPDAGQVNGCTARRQPGSSIKPFLYALALANGLPASSILPDTVVEFVLTDGTKFAPRNYGERYHGPTRLREALASSFNVPAVSVLERLGVQRFYDFLKTLHFFLDRPSNFYGLALSLGSAEVSLLEMVNGYRAIARAGTYTKEKVIQQLIDIHGDEIEVVSERPERILSRDVAYIITDILSDNAGRIKAFGEDNPLNLPFPCAAKTGTSKDYRDNWCIGFTNQYVIGVWVGNFDGSPMKGVSGISGAAPLFRDIMIEMHRNENPGVFEEPAGLVHMRICTKSGMIATKLCPGVIDEIFIPGTEPVDSCPGHGLSRVIDSPYHEGEEAKGIEILNPGSGDIFKIDPQVSVSAQAIKFMVGAGPDVEEVTFLLDEQCLARKGRPFEYIWEPMPGKHRLEVLTMGKKIKKSAEVLFSVY